MLQYISFISLLFFSTFCLAEQDAKKKEKPNLGSCSEYTDYYIYKCEPFSCKLPVAGMPGVTREMETTGYEKGYCIHKYKLSIRNKNFPFTDLKMSCKLTKEGRLELANQFTKYKEGETSVYANPSVNDVVSKECSMY